MARQTASPFPAQTRRATPRVSSCRGRREYLVDKRFIKFAVRGKSGHYTFHDFIAVTLTASKSLPFSRLSDITADSHAGSALARG